MHVLILGSGGREHALAWKLKQSTKVKRIFVAPGNAGTAGLVENIDASTKKEILIWLKQNPIDLVVVGPDNLLAEGIVDEIQRMGIKVFGPTQAAAEIEWSKSFAKQFMMEESIPTASFKIFNNYDNARQYILTQKYPLVLKASGLALGKGVIIAEDQSTAEQALREIMKDKIFGEAGAEVVVEEYLAGREISIHAFCDGENAVLFPASQDHKRIFENDQGPNTGGMGTIAPVPWVTPEILNEIKEKIVLPTLRGLKKRGCTFQGVLFPGIMITDIGPKVIEFNARFGDPETQSYMRILESDLLDILLACVDGRLIEQSISWSNQFACCVVCASSGYPGPYKKDLKITGLDAMPNNIQIFHAGTKLDQGDVLTNGGRVLGVTNVAPDLSHALDGAYQAINNIEFEGMQFRKDIGQKSLRKNT